MKIKSITKLTRKFTKFDIETRNHNLVANGIVVHNCNSRYVFVDNQQYCGSRSNWKKDDDKCLWWTVYYNKDCIGNFCRDNPGVQLYGEIFGQVQDLRYGRKGVDFVAFDILKDGKWLDVNEFLSTCEKYSIPVVPTLAINFPFNYELIEGMSNGPSMIPGADCIREGICLRPMIERCHTDIGRVCLKLVGNDYYMRKEK